MRFHPNDIPAVQLIPDGVTPVSLHAKKRLSVSLSLSSSVNFELTSPIMSRIEASCFTPRKSQSRAESRSSLVSKDPLADDWNPSPVEASRPSTPVDSESSGNNVSGVAGAVAPAPSDKFPALPDELQLPPSSTSSSILASPIVVTSRTLEVHE